MAATAPAPEVQAAPASAAGKRTMGLWMATGLVIGNISGSLLPRRVLDARGPCAYARRAFGDWLGMRWRPEREVVS